MELRDDEKGRGTGKRLGRYARAHSGLDLHHIISYHDAGGNGGAGSLGRSGINILPLFQHVSRGLMDGWRMEDGVWTDWLIG